MDARLFRVAVAALALAAVVPSSSQATLLLSTGTDNQNTDNVFFDHHVTGNPITGSLSNQADVDVFFSTTQPQGLDGDGAAGQASVQILGNTNQTPIPLTDISVNLQSGLQFDKILFNATGGGGSNSGTGLMTLSVFTNLGTTTFSEPLDGNGDNKFTLMSLAGEHIIKITIDAAPVTGDFRIDSLRQVRIGLITAVPEPATLATAIFGSIPVGLMAIRRRSRRLTPLS